MVMLPSIRRKYMANRIPKGATVSMSECVVTLASDRAVYTGGARTVGVTVTWGGTTIEVNEDYTVAYANNTNLGPATVTVTGMGQFSGSVTKTFYIVSASSVPWDFKIEDATSVGSLSVNQYSGWGVLPLLEGYQSNGLLVIGRWSTNSWLVGYSVSRDGEGDFHVANIETSSVALSDGSGADGNTYLIAVSPDGKNSYWVPNSSSGVIKQKSGSAYDFANMTYKGASQDISEYLEDTHLYQRGIVFANNGRYVFIPQKQAGIRRFSLNTPYDITTLDASSLSVQSLPHASGAGWKVYGIVFGSDGYEALVSTDNAVLYQFRLSSPYDFTNVETVSTLSPGSTLKTLCVVNGGKTLLAGNATSVFEFSLSASS